MHNIYHITTITDIGISLPFQVLVIKLSMNFGERLSKIRKSQNKTQQECADLMCTSINSYRKLEYTADNPRLSTIEKAIKVFGVSLDELFPELCKNIAELGEPEQELLSNFNRLSDDQKAKVIELIKLM